MRPPLPSSTPLATARVECSGWAHTTVPEQPSTLTKVRSLPRKNQNGDETQMKSPRSRVPCLTQFPPGNQTRPRSGVVDDGKLSMQARVEVTKKYAAAYAAASKKDKTRILDQVVEVTGWNRDHARQQLGRRLVQPKGRVSVTVAVLDRRRAKPRKYSYDALLVLQKVWAVSGGSCGKYLAAVMTHWLDALEAEGELVNGTDRYSPEVRTELISMSAATIDRYLTPARAKDPIRGKSATKPGHMLRTSITIRKAGDEVEAEPGFFEIDTVAHCGPTLKGEFARSVNFTDVHIGWTFTRAIRNNAAVHVISAFDAFTDTVPYLVTGIDVDNGSEFINHDLMGWAGTKDVYFTRTRATTKPPSSRRTTTSCAATVSTTATTPRSSSSS